MSKGRILVVEDDFDISNMLRIYFNGQGYEVQVAPRGGDALSMTRKQLPNLIMLDIMLPDMNGYDVCRELRTTTRTSHIPIIFLTQRDERSDRIAGLELGADDYVTKPFDIEELKLRVQNAIAAANRQTQIDSKSNLPTGRLMKIICAPCSRVIDPGHISTSRSTRLICLQKYMVLSRVMKPFGLWPCFWARSWMQ